MNEGKRVFTAEDELRYQTVHSAKLSPDGKQVVFSVKKNDLESEKTYMHLWLVDLEKGDTSAADIWRDE